MSREQFKKLEIGQKIKFKNNLIIGETYGFLMLLYGMDVHIGKVVTVCRKSDIVVNICEDICKYAYTPEMFEDTFKFGK